METSKSNFLIGLAIGSAIGALAQRFSRTAKAKMLKKKIHNAMAKIADRAESLTETVRDKALDASTKTADKVADATFDVAEKADTLKSKVHAAALEADVHPKYESGILSFSVPKEEAKPVEEKKHYISIEG